MRTQENRGEGAPLHLKRVCKTSAELKRVRWPSMQWATLNAPSISSFATPSLVALRPRAVAPCRTPCSTSMNVTTSSLNFLDKTPSEKAKSCRFSKYSITFQSNFLHDAQRVYGHAINRDGIDKSFGNKA